jgi:hypothetical protein
MSSLGLSASVLGAAAGVPRVSSLDTPASVLLTVLSESGPEEREFGALWDEVGVAQADSQFSEYRHTHPEKRTIRFTLEAYTKLGIGGSVEGAINTLKSLTKRVPGKARSHRVVFSMGSQRFGPAFVESVHVPIYRYNSSGQALIVKEGSITLKELQP